MMFRGIIYLAAFAAAAAPAAAQVTQFGIICQTPYGWCRLPQAGPLGGQCFCATPQGPVYGYIRQ